MKNITDEIIRWEARNDKATETAIDGHWSTHQLRIVTPCKSDIGRRGSEHPRQCAAPPQSPRQRRRGASGCHILIRVKFQCSGIIVDDSIWIDGSPSATKGPENGCKDFRGPLAFATETWCLSQTVIKGKQACVSEITKQHTHLLTWACPHDMFLLGSEEPFSPLWNSCLHRCTGSALPSGHEAKPCPARGCRTHSFQTHPLPSQSLARLSALPTVAGIWD